MKPPVGAEGVGCLPGRVLRLRRALYGLQQAPRAWHKRSTAELKAKGFVKSNADPSYALWILYGSRGVLELFYVDDGMMDAKTTEEALVPMVATLVEIRALGEPVDFWVFAFIGFDPLAQLALTKRIRRGPWQWS
jgi:hypothetical protein